MLVHRSYSFLDLSRSICGFVITIFCLYTEYLGDEKNLRVLKIGTFLMLIAISSCNSQVITVQRFALYFSWHTIFSVHLEAALLPEFSLFLKAICNDLGLSKNPKFTLLLMLRKQVLSIIPCSYEDVWQSRRDAQPTHWWQRGPKYLFLDNKLASSWGR